MNKKEGLALLDLLPTGFNKTDEIIQALYSNDEGEGALSNELEEVVGFIRYYTETDDVRNHRGIPLEMIVTLFAKIKRQLMENDARMLRRMLALTVRKGDTIWGNPRDIEHVFETYFMGIRAYVCECTNDENLLAAGDFEDHSPWKLTGSAEFSTDARFSEKYGLYFDGKTGACSTNIDLKEEGVYTLHFMLRGKCGVKIKNEQNQYFDASASPNDYKLYFTDEEKTNYFVNKDWADAFCFLVLERSMSLTIEFVSADDEEAYIDYVRVFQKPLNPSYTVLIQYEGYKVTNKSLHLAEGTDDPIHGVNYAKKSYFDHSYIVGRHGAYRIEVFNALLDIVRPRGIQAFTDFVEKAYIEGDEEDTALDRSRFIP